MAPRLSFTEAVAKKEHLLALGQTEVWLDRDDADDHPWGKVTRVEAGSSWRLSIPTSARVYAESDGLTFTWSFDFEERDANGRGIYMFDRPKLREIARKLPPKAREAFAELLQNQALPAMRERTAEVRQALNTQLDSEDCVRALIADLTEQPA